jgi:hypothetical protein
MLNTKNVDETLIIDSETISYNYFNKKNNHMNIVSIHGAGPGGKDAVSYLKKVFITNGYNLLTFDHSGHGRSTGAISNSSLSKRVREALTLIRTKNIKEPFGLMGTSMGGHICLELLGKMNIDKLILFCPALYSSKAYSLPFNQQFTKEIRKHKSYMNASIIENLKNFSGDFFLIQAEKDNIIPEEVIEIYWKNAINCTKKKKLILKDTPHPIHKWAHSNREIRELIIKEINTFLSNE